MTSAEITNIKKFNFNDLSKNKSGAELIAKPVEFENKIFEYFSAEVKQEDPKFYDADLKKASEEGYKRGFEEASKQVKIELENNLNNAELQIVNLCNSIIQKLDGVIKDLQNKNQNFHQECIELASKIAKNIAGEALKNNPTENIAKLFETSIKEFYSEPEVNVKVHPKHLESLNSRFSKIAIQKNFSGKINFVADAKINETDCMLEWASSGASIKNDEVIQKIDAIIAEYCKSIYNQPI